MDTVLFECVHFCVCALWLGQRKARMKKTAPVPVLEISIGEFGSFLEDANSGWRIGDVARALSSEERGGDYTIPAADNAGDLTFNNLEVMRRFVSTSVRHQKAFLFALRRAMEANRVQKAELSVGWAHNRNRVLIVELSGNVHMSIRV